MGVPAEEHDDDEDHSQESDPEPHRRVDEAGLIELVSMLGSGRCVHIGEVYVQGAVEVSVRL